jgi:uncharacterized protein
MAAQTTPPRHLPSVPPWHPSEDLTPTPAPPVAEPGMLGFPAFIVGSVAFGMVLLGVFPAMTAGSALAIILAASLGLWLTVVWAARLGESAPAGFFGVVASFFTSYAVLVLGLTHNWFGIAPAAIADTQKTFVISWMVIVALLIVAALRVPLIYLALFTVVEVALFIDLLGIIQSSESLTKAAGYVTMGFAAIAVYLFASSASKAAGGKEFPLGKPLIKA